MAGPALAQSIEVSDLDAPQAFAPGLDAIGGLEPSAWSGTSAERAIRLLSDIDAAPTHPIARDMLRRVVLGGLAKPDGAEGALGDDLEDNFVTARIRAAQISLPQVICPGRARLVTASPLGGAKPIGCACAAPAY